MSPSASPGFGTGLRPSSTTEGWRFEEGALTPVADRGHPCWLRKALWRLSRNPVSVDVAFRVTGFRDGTSSLLNHQWTSSLLNHQWTSSLLNHQWTSSLLNHQ